MNFLTSMALFKVMILLKYSGTFLNRLFAKMAAMAATWLTGYIITADIW
jgi:hypothetical protein